jgi:hypothetical protein
MTILSIAAAIQKAYLAVRDRSTVVKPSRWQSMDVSKLAEATTHEVLNYTLQTPIGTESLDELRKVVEPNLPWADDHFLERVSGKPLNPGVEWAHWPWGNSANSFRRAKVFGPGACGTDVGGNEPGFDHTYMERMWPKAANLDSDGIAEGGGFYPDHVRRGIRFTYGDASDVVEHLAKHPDSRQAYLPIWHPEDTGKTDVRVPCTLGYHFIHRHGFLHCTYYIRSCDLYRHFRDDIYLTVRLQLWMLDQLRLRTRPDGIEGPITAPGESFWDDVQPGLFTMHIVSLHCFVNDYSLLFRGKK